MTIGHDSDRIRLPPRDGRRRDMASGSESFSDADCLSLVAYSTSRENMTA